MLATYNKSKWLDHGVETKANEQSHYSSMSSISISAIGSADNPITAEL